MNAILERHRYAPELNTLHYRGVPFRVAGAISIGEARKKLFNPCKKGIVATIEKTYPKEMDWLNRCYSGYVTTRNEALALARQLRAGLAAGGRVTVRTRIVG